MQDSGQTNMSVDRELRKPREEIDGELRPRLMMIRLDYEIAHPSTATLIYSNGHYQQHVLPEPIIPE